MEVYPDPDRVRAELSLRAVAWVEKHCSLIETVARVTAWLLVIAIVVLSLIPPSDLPTTGAPRGFEHFFIFVATGAAFRIGYANSWWQMASALVLFAGVIELIQFGAPGRHARISDFFVDAIGSCIGVGVAWVVIKSAGRIRNTWLINLGKTAELDRGAAKTTADEIGRER